MTTDALALLSSLVLEDGRRWGDAADPHQLADAVAVLDLDGPPYNYLTRARGYSKTADLAAVGVAVMLEQLPAGSRLYGIAADRDQGRLLVDSVSGYAQRTPGLSNAITVNAYNVTARNGSVLEILAADEAGSWGLRPSFAVVDELAQWATTRGPRKLWEAVTSALPKVPGRLVVLTSAGDPAHWSHMVLEHAQRDPLWRVHEIPGPPPWADPERLAEQRRRLPVSVYARLFENTWTASEDRLTSLDDLRACVTLDGPQSYVSGRRPYVVAADLGVKNDKTAVCVCHVDGPPESPTVVLDRMNVWSGSRKAPVQLDEVEGFIAQASEAYGGTGVVLDPWQAVGMAQRLRARGLGVVEFTFSGTSVGRLASTLHTTIRNRRLALPDDPDLLDELANVRLRETSPGVLRMDHDPDKHDDRAIALALAVTHLLEHSGPRRRAQITHVSRRRPPPGTIVGGTGMPPWPDGK